MEALNALGLKPICFLPEKRSKPRKIFTVPTICLPKLSESARIGSKPSSISDQLRSLSFHIGSLVLLSSGITTKVANALSYEEALQQSVSSSSGDDFDVGGLVDSVVNNPALVFGGVALLAVPLILSQVFWGKPKPFGVETAKNAYAKLADDPAAQLLDIRSLKGSREVGSPDIRGLQKRPISIVYESEDRRGFLQKLAKRFKEPETTTLYILDKFDGNSELVADLVTAYGFKAAYAIKDGVEGPRGWLNSGLPWILPKKAFNLDFGGLTEVISGVLPEGSEALPVALGIAAATGLGLLAFTEVETILQLLGSAALIQFTSKKLLFAEDRKQTLLQVDEFLSTKVAPKELVDEIKQIGAALLPLKVSTKALPAPAEAAAETVVNNSPVPEVEPPAELAQGNNSAPKTEVKDEEPFAGLQRPLSPYPSYPDWKPPSSPSPSPP
ncbi:hypothetical protein Dimus_025340 [Dionaea muscipula]